MSFARVSSAKAKATLAAATQEREAAGMRPPGLPVKPPTIGIGIENEARSELGREPNAGCQEPCPPNAWPDTDRCEQRSPFRVSAKLF